MSDRLVGLLLLAGCGLFYWQSFAIRPPPFAAFETLGAETFPRAVIVVLALFSAVLVVRGPGPLVPHVDGAAARAWLERYRLPLASLALFALYAVAIPLVGWLAATIAFLVAMQVLLRPGRGREIYVVGGSIAFAWALAFLFERFLHVVLPRATLF